MDAVVLVRERGESTSGLCSLVCRLVANDAASSRASAADTNQRGRCRPPPDVLPLHRHRRAVYPLCCRPPPAR
jgi:hypothetical protein